jgi:hypothetical protein
MTPGRLYLLSVLCLLLAALLLLREPRGTLANVLGGALTVLALLSYLTGLYLARLGRRGESALADLRERVALGAGRDIREEHRAYHLRGLDELGEGDLLIFYRTDAGWLLVPLADTLTWYEVPAAGVRAVELAELSPGRGVELRLDLAADGRRLQPVVTSTRVERSRQTPENVGDLVALRDALGGG